jgi:acetate kinase
MKCIVVVNCGSSSVKVDVFDEQAHHNPWSGTVERVGTDQATLKTVHGDQRAERLLGAIDHGGAVKTILGDIAAAGFAIGAVVHRVVHGGTHFADSVVITDDVIAAVEACVPLAPLHNPANLKGMAATRAGRSAAAEDLAALERNVLLSVLALIYFHPRKQCTHERFLELAAAALAEDLRQFLAETEPAA